ncbi:MULTISPECIES: sigma-70 family RNA polymerase sigma factor [Brevibacillus]|uniref:sigma-70 family RNA polymerase sigma factor n=1 Tax=Brevibacillus TaxID=55080 RepID=UPI001F606F32|nr:MULTISPECIES: sigma-70 family RNA polymerase sigma factor [Brevibacillus]MDH6348874.1 RNA polymerase sigma factor (sigma-70 family) [Brevibacillus sp. 1238]
MNLEQLVRQARQGDDEAFYQLICQQQKQLYSVAYAFLRNEADTLEAIQEATCRSYLRLSLLKEPAHFRTWLTRILIHVCLDELKRKKRFASDWHAGESLAIPFGSQMEQTAEKLVIEEALAKLTPMYRSIILMKYFEDLTIREIASRLGYPEGTVKTWLHKALGALRKDLGKGW